MGDLGKVIDVALFEGLADDVLQETPLLEARDGADAALAARDERVGEGREGVEVGGEESLGGVFEKLVLNLGEGDSIRCQPAAAIDRRGIGRRGLDRRGVGRCGVGRVGFAK